jgi:hypothetical protein
MENANTKCKMQSVRGSGKGYERSHSLQMPFCILCFSMGLSQREPPCSRALKNAPHEAGLSDQGQFRSFHALRCLVVPVLEDRIP